MKILKKFADLFSEKTTAQEQSAETQTVEHPQTEDGPKDPPCTVYSFGELEYPAFIPQPLLSFYLMKKAVENRSYACGDISMVKAVSLFHPQSSAFIRTVFAIKEEKGYVWAEVGSRQVNFSRPEAFIYRPAGSFRIRIRQKDDKTSYVAVCEYKKEKVRVTAIVEEVLTPPTDADRERFVRCKKLPCSLEEAAAFVESLG